MKKIYFDEIKVMHEIEEVENSKPTLRLLEKTQVLVPETGRDSIAKNRLTHSYEVSTSAKMIAAHIAKSFNVSILDIDYQNCLHQVSLLHDIGHPPFGHDGQEFIDRKFKEKGLVDGFSDNNNNLVVIEAHSINVRDYVKASVIKYPNKLYPYQKDIYIDILSKSLSQDQEHFKEIGINLQKQSTTIACQIMDEADRNSYTCSDLVDFFTLGNKVSASELKKFFKQDTPEEIMLFKKMINAIESENSREIRSFFSDLKNSFNANFQLTDTGISHKNESLNNFRESLSAITYEFFIKPIRNDEYHMNNMKMLDIFINKSIEEDYCKSTFYKDKISKSQTDIEKLTAIRDMVSEVGDWYVIKQITEMTNNEELHFSKPKKGLSINYFKK